MALTTRREVRTCSACGEGNPTAADCCLLCGSPMNNDDSIHLELPEGDPEIRRLAPTGLIRGKYRPLRSLAEFADLFGFVGVLEEPGHDRVPIIIRARPQSLTGRRPGAGPPRGAADSFSSADTVRLIVGNTQVDYLQVEYETLKVVDHLSLPKVLDFFEEADCVILVETTAIGRPLMEIWRDEATSDGQRVAWLEQIRQALAALHEVDVVFPGLQPSRVVVDETGHARIRDVSGLARLPLARPERAWINYYAAPETTSAPNETDLRCDAYNFGALLYALLLGRELREEDFQHRGLPRPYSSLVPEAPPPLVRLLAKTFIGNPHLRFPTEKTKDKDRTALAELGDALAEYGRVAWSVRYDISGWSSTGMLRENNEDCFTVSSLQAGAGDYRRDMALVCVADGMGGLAGGEIASATAVSTVAEYLRVRGLSSGSMDQFGVMHPFHDADQCGAFLLEAVYHANQRVYATAQESSRQTQMGCTIDALLLVNQQAVVCHVGDSRVYHRRGEELRQITVDQTLVYRLVEMGQLSEEEAEIHPYRSAIYQAVGAQPEVEPAQFHLQVAVGDWLVVCTDGLTGHVNAEDINDVLAKSATAEAAARRLVNLANERGGTDNCTVVVARIR